MISLSQVLSYSARLSAAGLVGGALSAGVQVLIARRLGPEDLGVVGLVQLFLLYAGMSRPGILMAGYREMLHALGQDDSEEAKRIEGVALTGEAAALAIPFCMMAAAALFWKGAPAVRAALAIGAATFLINSLFQFVDTIQWAYHRFELVARVNMLVKFGQPLFLLGGLYAFGLYGVLAAPLATSAFALLYYLTRTRGLHHTYSWDGPELARLLRAGLPLAFYSLAYWALRSADRMMAARFLSLQALGYYTFAMTFLNQACQLVSDFLNVLQASLLTELGRLGRVRPLAGHLTRLQVLIAAGTGAAAALSQLCVAPFLAWVVPKFSPAAPAIETMTLLFPATTAPLLSVTVLLSSVVDRPGALTAVQALGLVVNLAIGAALISLGCGLEGIAWASALTQWAAAAAAMGLLHRSLFEAAPAGEAARYYAWSAALAALPIALHFLLRGAAMSWPGAGGILAGLAAASGTWGAIAFLIRRSWPAEHAL